MKTLELAFSTSYGASGDKTTYAHFIWGYVLPAMHEILDRTEAQAEDYRLVIEDCGPVMNKVSQSLFGLFGKEISIIQSDEFSDQFIDVPRWDLLSVHKHARSRIPFMTYKKYRSYCKSLKYLKTIQQPNFKAKFRDSILRVRNWVLGKTIEHGQIAHSAETGKALTQANAGSRTSALDILVLKRSGVPEFYRKAIQGRRGVGYGASRRYLNDIDDFVSKYADQGFNISVYEPGGDSIHGQIAKFNQCKVVVGLRGSECSNIVWMQPHSRFVMLTPSDMRRPPLYKPIADMCNVSFQNIGTKHSEPAQSLMPFEKKIVRWFND